MDATVAERFRTEKDEWFQVSERAYAEYQQSRDGIFARLRDVQLVLTESVENTQDNASNFTRQTVEPISQVIRPVKFQFTVSQEAGSAGSVGGARFTTRCYNQPANAVSRHTTKN